MKEEKQDEVEGLMGRGGVVAIVCCGLECCSVPTFVGTYQVPGPAKISGTRWERETRLGVTAYIM